MALTEFELIERFFSRTDTAAYPQVRLGVGDDCALLALEAGEELAVSVDNLVSGVHFPEGLAGELLGWRSLAVAASDLAGCGARPLGFTLALTLPNTDEAWLEGYSQSLARAAQAFALPLIGGNIARGPLNLALQVMGAVPAGQALLRSGARPGDQIWVSGTLGDGRAALDFLDDSARDNNGRGGDVFLERYYWPQPRLALGEALRGIASAAIDISDGLAADLGHILERSSVGARVDVDALPLSSMLRGHYPPDTAREYALTGGDDYELCFTAPSARRGDIEVLASSCGVGVTCIGEIIADRGLHLFDRQGREVALARGGYQHFE